MRRTDYQIVNAQPSHHVALDISHNEMQRLVAWHQKMTASDLVVPTVPAVVFDLVGEIVRKKE